jgi:hypothetical protein
VRTGEILTDCATIREQREIAFFHHDFSTQMRMFVGRTESADVRSVPDRVAEIDMAGFSRHADPGTDEAAYQDARRAGNNADAGADAGTRKPTVSVRRAAGGKQDRSGQNGRKTDNAHALFPLNVTGTKRRSRARGSRKGMESADQNRIVCPTRMESSERWALKPVPGMTAA